MSIRRNYCHSPPGKQFFPGISKIKKIYEIITELLKRNILIIHTCRIIKVKLIVDQGKVRLKSADSLFFPYI